MANDTMTHEQLIQKMAASVVTKVTMWFEILGDKNAAIAKAKDESCAGPAAWKVAMERMGW
jgi:hypothetical protein